tara:strand:- start:840 stop:1082 length:243 start_codon:yes stop_codon:yes gene_type:complete
MKLINKIKPEILNCFEKETKEKYNSSYNDIMTFLNNVSDYRDLTIENIKTLNAFAPKDFAPKSEIDYYYGDNLLSKEHQL